MDLMEPQVKTVGQYFNRKTTISFLVGVFFGVIFTVPLVERGKLNTDFLANVFDREEKVDFKTEDQKDKDTESTFSLITLGENSLVVSNQRAGGTVIMSMVSLDTSGWVAVHEEGVGGELGNILGARRFEPGQYFGSAIELLRGTKENMTYYVVLHVDDGDGIFDYEKEVPVKNASGEFIIMEFIATSAQ